jgi:uncharacterized protein (DUF1330 family)
MPAYVLVEITVQDPVAYETVKLLTPPTVYQYGGRYIARGGETYILEGDWSPRRLVILQFDSLERALAWHSSPEYAEARRLRNQYARSNMVAIDGLPEGFQP